MATGVVPQNEAFFPVWLAACVTGASTVVFGVLPILMGLFADQLSLGWQQLGWLGAAQQAGSLSGTLLASRLVDCRTVKAGVLLGSGGAVVFGLLSASTSQFALLLCWQTLAGAGIGCVFAIGTYLVGCTAEPERSFSMMFGVQVACSCAYAALLPLIRLHLGYELAISSVALWFAAIFALALYLPSGQAPRARKLTPPAEPYSASRFESVCALSALAAFEIAAVAIWVYSERLGVRSGLTAGDIGAAIAIGGLGGLPAAGLGSVLGDRFGRAPILIVASLMVLAGALGMLGQATFASYVGGQLALNFGWILGLSYYTGLVAVHDLEGRAVRLVPPTIIVAAGVAPACMSLFGIRGEQLSTLGVSGFFCLTALLLALPIAGDRARAAGQARLNEPRRGTVA